MKKVTAIFLALAMISCMLSACGSQQTAAPAATEAATQAQAAETQAPAQASSGDDMLVVLAPQGSSDKLAAGWYNTGTISYAMLFSKVLTLDPDNNPSTDGESLADSYTASDDFMEYEFTLKDGVKFHDGQPLTAEDVKYSIEFACRFGTINSVVFNTFKCIEGFDALSSGAATELSGITADGNKLKIKLASPTAYLVFTMGSFDILPKHILETCDPVTFATNDFWAKPVGSGPYKLKEFKPNDYMILEKFDDYYGKVPEIGLVKEAFVAEGDYVTLCQAGEIDYFHTMDVATALEVEKLGTYTVKNVPIMYIFRQDFNFPPLNWWLQNDENPLRQGITENFYNQGYLRFWDEILRRNPDIWINSVSSGGRRSDLETMARSVSLHQSDYGYGQHPLLQEVMIFGYTWMAYFGTFVQNHDDLEGNYNYVRAYERPYEKDGTDNFAAHNAFCPFMHFNRMGRRSLSVPGVGFAETEEGVYYRKFRELWKRAVPYLLEGDFYLLRRTDRTNKGVQALQFHNENTGEGILQIISNTKTPEQKITVYPFQFDPESEYILESPEFERKFSVTGREANESGITVEIPPRTGEIFFYKKAKC